jgi:hypothetical protein
LKAELQIPVSGGCTGNLFLFIIPGFLIILYCWTKKSKAMQACNFARDKPVSTEFSSSMKEAGFIPVSLFGKTLENNALKNA